MEEKNLTPLDEQCGAASWPNTPTLQHSILPFAIDGFLL